MATVVCVSDCVFAISLLTSFDWYTELLAIALHHNILMLIHMARVKTTTMGEKHMIVLL